MKALIVFIGNLLAVTTWAAEPANVIPAELAQRLLQQDPAVQVARSEVDAAEAEASQIEASPYEWTASVSGQRRNVAHEAESNEWNVGIERTLRLPGKSTADHNIAKATRNAGNARYNVAINEAASALLGLWMDWLEAHSATALLNAQQQAIEENVTVVEKRVRSGDAAQLDLRFANAELADIRREASEADTMQATSWSRLVARFPVESIQPAALPEPAPVERDEKYWSDVIVNANDQLMLARAEWDKAQAVAIRSMADKLPDPTIGAFTASEARGDEKIVGISFSMPFPGARRGLQAQQQLAAANTARLNLDLTQRELNGRASTAYLTAKGNYERWQLAKTAADAVSENARLSRRAYSLGEQDFQALLLARRQAITAAQAESKARADAWRARYELLLLAKQLWGEAKTTSLR